MYGFASKTQLPKSKKSYDVITLISTCIQVAELHWENHSQRIEVLLGFLLAKNSDYFVTYTDIYVHI